MDIKYRSLLGIMLALLLSACSAHISDSAPSSVPAPQPSPTSTIRSTISTESVAPQITPTSVINILPRVPPSGVDGTYQGVLTLDGRVFDAVFSPDGASVWLAFEDGNRLFIGEWKLSDAPAESSQVDLDVTSTSCMARETSLSISPDDNFLAVSIGKSIVFVNTMNGEILDKRAVLSKYVSPWVQDFAFSPDGSRYALGGRTVEIANFDDPDAYTHKVRLVKNESAHIYTGLEPDLARESGLDAAHVIEYSPDGRLLAVGGAQYIGVWDSIATFGFQFYPHYDFVQSIAFSPDSQSLVFVSDNGKLHYWDLSGIWSSPEVPNPELVIDGGVGTGATYSPDGEMIAVGMSDGSIQFRDASTLQLIKSVQVHASRVTSVEFSRSGARLLSSAYDGRVQISDVERLLTEENGDIVRWGAPDNSGLRTDERELSLESVYMLDAHTGWAVDKPGRLLMTEDGGYHWRDVSPENGIFTESGLYVQDNSTAWAVPAESPCYYSGCPDTTLTHALVWKTEDGGDSWVSSHPFYLGRRGTEKQAVAYFQPLSLQFVDPMNGWLLASVDRRMRRDFYRLYHTSDGGHVWELLIDETTGPALIEVFDIAFLDRENGYFTGEGLQEYYDADHFYYSGDAGAHWDRTNLKGLVIWQCCSVDEMTMERVSSDAVIVDARAQGIQSLSTNCEQELRERHSMLISPTGGLYKPWMEISDWEMKGYTHFMNERDGWMLVLPGGELSNTLQRTNDGGYSWEIIRRVSWEEAQFSFINEDIGWAVVFVGEESALVRTLDGGQGWTEIKPRLEE
jgi:WD40 repeat protein/photosystem II stability/assembly factor-like uncharacterized protein